MKVGAVHLYTVFLTYRICRINVYFMYPFIQNCSLFMNFDNWEL